MVATTDSTQVAITDSTAASPAPDAVDQGRIIVQGPISSSEPTVEPKPEVVNEKKPNSNKPAANQEAVVTKPAQDISRIETVAKPEVSKSGSMRDQDGNVYRTVTIGEQEWMAENLDVSTFRNGDPIPQAKTDKEWRAAGKAGKPAWCYYENSSSNGDKYGKLYNWYAVNDSRGLAPMGWSVPNDQEWTQLENAIGSNPGKQLRSQSGWWYDNGHGTDDYGFAGLPGGVRDKNGDFKGLYKTADWWSASGSNSGNAWYRNMDLPLDNMGRHDGNKSYGFSVRCLRD